MTDKFPLRNRASILEYYDPNLSDEEKEGEKQVWTGKQYGVTFELSRLLGHTANETVDYLWLELEDKRGEKRFLREFKDAFGEPSMEAISGRQRPMVGWPYEVAMRKLSLMQPSP